MTTKPASQATQGDALRAAMFMLYSDPKLFGKTTIFLRTFCRALLIGQRSAIQLVAESGCGFTPQPWQFIEGITTLPQLVWFLSDTKDGLRSPAWQAAIKTHGIDAIYVDDFSHICTKSVIEWSQTDKGQKDKFFKYNMLDQYLEWASFLLRDLGMLCGLSAHKLEPKYDTNEKSRTYGKLISIGAPEVPSSKQIQAVPGWVDFVAPIRVGPSKDPWWPRVICNDPGADTLWLAGDRNNVAWAETPANLREILRAAPTPYNLARLPGLEWQDEVAEGVAAALDTGEPVLPILERVFAHFKDYARPGTPGERHVQWACQDGIARHTIRAHRAQGVLGALRAQATAAAPPPPITGQ